MTLPKGFADKLLKLISPGDKPDIGEYSSFLATLTNLLLENMNEFVFILDADLKLVLYNTTGQKRFEEVLGKNIVEGTPFFELFNSNQSAWKERLDRVLEGRNLKIHEQINPDTDVIYTRFHLKPVVFKKKVVGVVIIGEDQNLQKDNLNLIKEQQETFRTLTENIKSALFTFNDQGFYIYVNPEMERVTGYSKKELKQLKFYEIVHPDHASLVKKRGYARLNDDPILQSYEFKILTKQGKVKWVEISNAHILLKGKSYVLGTAIDITDRKKAEEQLKIERAYLENLFNNSPEAIVVTSNEGIVRSINKEFTNLFGYTEEEAQGIHVDKLLAPNEKQREAGEKTQSVANGNRISSESVRLRKDGNVIHVSILGAPIIVEGRQVAVYGIYRDITERIKYEEEIKEAKEKAEESDRLKSSFLANMSHEIRTPMNAILGFSRLLKEPELTEEQKSEYLDIIASRGNHLLKIIEDIIDLSKIEANQLQIQEKEFNLNELLDELNTIFDKEIQTERKHSLTLTLSKELPDEKANVKLDKTRLQQILTNLLSNAIKYTESGKIEFGYKLVKSSSWYYLQFYVSDTGIGIPEDKQDIVFDRFRQSDDSQTRSYGGTGLGLSISKALIEKMGGTIWLDSEPDSGTVLYFVLPLLNYNEQMMDHTQNSVEPMNVNWKGKQILIVEDDVLSVKFLEAILEGTGAETIHVKRGQNAIDMVKSKRIDLILMDIQLPGMDGNEATAQIRKFNDEVPIIAQTAHAMSEDKRKSIQSGCNDYITKPIDSNLLLVKIKEQFIKRE